MWYLRVLTTVNCSATMAKLVAEAASRDPWFQRLENMDGIVPIVHGTGGAMVLKGEGHQVLFRTLQGYAQHANFGRNLLIGLGCEAVQALVGAERLRADNNLRYMTIRQKGGTAPMVGFYEYAQPITTPGFPYMDSPGNDPASVTGQIASRADLIAFTTGRGSVSGFKPAPGLKLATNTKMYDHMAEDMDINCGDIITGGVSIAGKGPRQSRPADRRGG